MKNSVRYFFRRPSVRVTSVAMGLCFVVLAMVWARAFYGSKQAYQEGEAYFKKHQYIKAITFFDRSIHWYTPFNPYVRQSAQRLWEIGVQAEQEGDIRLALIAIRTIRRGFFSARSFYTPGKDWISKCDTKITSLMAKELEGQSLKEKVAVPCAGRKNPEPDIFWTLILEVGFLGWIGSVIGFLMHALTRGDPPQLKSRPAILWGIMVIIFYTLWIIGMMRA
ncbi:MAG: hypothetical protein JRJ42_03400 [Deltaproteobacteria bacterium]|nr:hypothetical protein [Deltaproteobacteria bacterium]MBW2018485.1 hypothetical protein [Deltaproteobacteria bacterium]MBW2074142.1 hypothetical protein [Deltaproteobacteria bacterium]